MGDNSMVTPHVADDREAPEPSEGLARPRQGIDPLALGTPVSRFEAPAGLLSALLLVSSGVLSLNHSSSGTLVSVLLGLGLVALAAWVWLATPADQGVGYLDARHSGCAPCMVAGLMGAVVPVVIGFALFAGAVGRHASLLCVVVLVVVTAMMLYATTSGHGHDRRRWLWAWFGVPLAAAVGDLVGIALALFAPGALRLEWHETAYQTGPMVLVAIVSFLSVAISSWRVIGKSPRG